MKETENLKLKKPDQEDFYNIEDFNFNADAIDAAIYALQLAKVSAEERKTWNGKADNNEASGTKAGLLSASDKRKLDGIDDNANNYELPEAAYGVVGGVKTTSQIESTNGLTPTPIISGVPYYKDSTSHVNDKGNPHNVTKAQIGLENVDNTSDLNKPVSVPVQEALDAYYAQLTAYADKGIADLIGGAPTTMDTLKEVHDAIEENKDVQEALDAAIGTKAAKAEYDSHVATMASKTASGHVKIDDVLSASSINPVQNKVVKAALDGKANTSHTHGDVWEKVYPVGAIYISTVNTSPATLFGGKWEQITSGYLRAGTSYATKTDGSNTATGAATGNTGSTTLTAAQSGVPAHSHGLNSHTHTGPSHSHGVGTLATASNGAHTHTISHGSIGVNNIFSSGTGFSINTFDFSYETGGISSNGAHTHTISGSTAAAGTGNTGAASGNTANNTGTAASSGHTHTLNSHTHPINLNYVQVYMWRRTA